MKDLKNHRLFTIILAIITAVLITFFTFKYGEGSSVLIVTPLYISICVLFLQSGVNRTAFLIGAINSLLYAAVYIYDGLYLTALYAALFSFPLQLWTYFRWRKKDSDGETIFKTLNNSVRIYILLGFIALFVILYYLLSLLGSNWGVYDCCNFLLGVLVTILCIVPYVEYSPLQCISTIIGFVMFLKMAKVQPLQYTYLVYQAYSIICVLQAFIKIIRIYKKQNRNN